MLFGLRRGRRPPPTVPNIPQDLVLWLNEQYPEKSLDPRKTLVENWMYAGRRALIQELIRIVERQSQVRLETKHVFRIAPTPPAPGNDTSATPGT